MFEFWEFLKTIIGTRVVQIIARYLGNGLSALIAYFSLSIPSDDQAKATTVIATIIGAVLCWGVDHLSHSIQKEDNDPIKDVFRFPPTLILLVLLPLLGGCSTAQIAGSGAGSAVAGAVAGGLLSHVGGASVYYDASTHQWGVHVDTRAVVSQAALCRAQAEADRRNYVASAKQRDADERETDKRELAKIADRKKHCSVGAAAGPVPDPLPSATSPSAPNDWPPAEVATIPEPDNAAGAPALAGTASASATQKCRALFVGINAYPNGAALPDCVLDVTRMESWLKTQAAIFPNPEIHRLRDEKATTANIERELLWLTSGLQAGDKIVFDYSGHGAETIESVSGQPDGHSQCICPVDFDWTPGHMITDTKFRMFFLHVPPGVAVFWISDSCHSGDLTRVPGRIPRTYPNPPEPILTAVRAAKARGARRALAGDDLNVGFIAGCKYSETSASTGHGGECTNAFLATVNTGNSYTKIVADMNAWIDTHGNDQTPQCEGGQRKFQFLGVK